MLSCNFGSHSSDSCTVEVYDTCILYLNHVVMYLYSLITGAGAIVPSLTTIASKFGTDHACFD